MTCSTPVVLIIFNRPSLASEVLGAIRRAQPRKLFIVADGARTPAEETTCLAARRVVDLVDWDCAVETNFSEANLGCGRRPATGLDWVFSQVEEAIILEDDCLPAPSFFPFCESLLDYYRDDRRIMHIGGSRFHHTVQQQPSSYSFSRYTLCWGWATWRRAWQSFDFEIKSWPEFKSQQMLAAIFPDDQQRRYWEKKLEHLHAARREDAWDYQWNYAVWAQGGLSIVPSVNLITNIGFGPEATHTRRITNCANLPAGEIDAIVHPRFVLPDSSDDRAIFNERFAGNRIRERSTWKYRLSKPARILKRWQKNDA